MKLINKKYPFILVSVICCLASCDEEPTAALEDIIKEDLGYMPVIATFELISPDEPEVEPGMNASFDLRFWSEGDIDKIEYWMIEGEDETMIGEQAYSPAYSMVSRTDSALFNFTVPASLQAGDTIAVQARVFNEGLEEYPATASVTLTVPE
jgi:hypothetical protein